MPQARSSRLSWSRKRVPRRALWDCRKRLRHTACSRPSIPTEAATTSTRPRPASRWTRPALPKSAGRSTSSASSTSRATARRGAAVWSGCSARSRAGCRRSYARRAPGGRQEGLASIEAANRWLATVYSPHHNARFAVARAEEGTAFVPFVGALDDILCVQEARVVGNDNTVRYAGRVLQIPEQRHRRHFVKANVRVHEHPDGRLAIFHGPRRLADYEADGSLIDQIRLVQTAA